ncbi:hypothetical protein ACIRG4_04055 [Streptomyces sp. NPDC102395]|uniref:hypothetical protein n=1 Tax=Streptomyces sp. NPDC102395 TaxID=3366168 RepID=UPI003819A4E8
MALTLIRPDHDVWKPGEHNGTSRGHNPAFVTRARALELFWSDRSLENRISALGERVRSPRPLLGTSRPPRAGGVRPGPALRLPRFAREVCDAA